MAILQLHRDKLRHNFRILNENFADAGIKWSVVTKLLCGNKDFLAEVLALDIEQVCDSRVGNLKAIKKLKPEVETIYIKPPPRRSIRHIVEYADISLNTEFQTIQALSETASALGKLHKIIIMVEMGDLREGVMGRDLVEFYSRVFQLRGIEVIGIGANLNCLNGVMPNLDKLVQLSLYKQIIELKFKQRINFISGGSSVTIPLLQRHQLPPEINHFRVGEALYFGNDLFTGQTIPGMHSDVFELQAEIIELTKKPFAPIGELAENPSGNVLKINPKDYKKVGFRAIIDIGLLDIDPKFLMPMDPDIRIIGASSDMIVLELLNGRKNYQVGSIVRFQVAYMGALGLMNSAYIDKEVIGGPSAFQESSADRKRGKTHEQRYLYSHQTRERLPQLARQQTVDSASASDAQTFSG